jgi:hypothetical protein
VRGQYLRFHSRRAEKLADARAFRVVVPFQAGAGVDDDGEDLSGYLLEGLAGALRSSVEPSLAWPVAAPAGDCPLAPPRDAAASRSDARPDCLSIPARSQPGSIELMSARPTAVNNVSFICCSSISCKESSNFRSCYFRHQSWIRSS